MLRTARRVGGRAGVVTTVMELQVVDDQRGGILVVGADGDLVDFQLLSAAVERNLLPVLVPLKAEGEISLQDLAGDGGPHPLC